MTMEQKLREMDRSLSTLAPMVLALRASVILSTAGLPVSGANARALAETWLDPKSPATAAMLDDIEGEVKSLLAAADAAKSMPSIRIG